MSASQDPVNIVTCHNYLVVNNYSTTDECGNETTSSQTVTVVDTTPPTFAAFTDPVTAECNKNSPPTTPSTTVSDECDAVVTYSSSDSKVDNSDGSSVYTYSYDSTDCAGNMASTSFTLTVLDTTPPTISLASYFDGDATYECGTEPTEIPDSTCADTCDESNEISCVKTDDVVTAVPQDVKLRTVYTWSATDQSGNLFTSTNTVTVRDTTKPTIDSSLHADVTLECDDPLPTAKVTGSDVCDTIDDDNISYSDDPNETSTCGTTFVKTRYHVVSDDHGNSETHTQVITTVDTTPPVFLVADSSETVECDSVPTSVSYTVSDNCDSTLTEDQTSVITAGNSTATTYELVFTTTAEDLCGNVATKLTTYTVVDTTPPVMDTTNIQDATYEAAEIPTIVDAQAPCSDNCATPIYIHPTDTLNRNFVVRSSDNCFSHELHFECDDLDGNIATHVQTITVKDITPPSIVNACEVLAADGTRQEGTNSFTFEYEDVPDSNTYGMRHLFATDENDWDSTADDDVVLTFQADRTNGNTVHEFTETWTYTATDYCGNETVEVCTIVSQDTKGPQLPEVENITVDCDEIPEACEVEAVPEEGDVFTTVYTETTQPVSASIYQLVRTWKVTDLASNTETRVQTVTVQDTVPPVLSREPADETIGCDCDEFHVPELDVTDNCSTGVTVSLTVETTGDPATGSYVLVRTWSATDSAGLSVEHKQTVTVVDEEEPRLYPLPANVAIDCTNVYEKEAVQAFDNCDESLSAVAFEQTTLSSTCSGTYNIERKWSITDAAGNDFTHKQTIEVTDTDAPSFNAGRSNVCAVAAVGDIEFANIASELNAADDCGTSTVSITCSNQAAGNVGTCAYDSATDKLTVTGVKDAEYLISITVSDDCNNEAQATRTYKIFESAVDIAAEGSNCA